MLGDHHHLEDLVSRLEVASQEEHHLQDSLDEVLVDLLQEDLRLDLVAHHLDLEDHLLDSNHHPAFRVAHLARDEDMDRQVLVDERHINRYTKSKERRDQDHNRIRSVTHTVMHHGSTYQSHPASIEWTARRGLEWTRCGHKLYQKLKYPRPPVHRSWT